MGRDANIPIQYLKYIIVSSLRRSKMCGYAYMAENIYWAARKISSVTRMVTPTNVGRCVPSMRGGKFLLPGLSSPFPLDPTVLGMGIVLGMGHLCGGSWNWMEWASHIYISSYQWGAEYPLLPRMIKIVVKSRRPVWHLLSEINWSSIKPCC